MTAGEVASQYIGQHEISGNMGFKDPCFEEKMESVGFEDGYAWCALFQELVFKEAFPEKFDELDKLFSASTIQTYRNFKDAGYTIKDAPVLYSLVIWQSMKSGKPHWSGHAGVVSKVLDKETFLSIEGNTNSGGSREGVAVAERTRKVIANVKDGLKILGFIIIENKTS